jgi:N-acetylglucosaminyl-diphospho-decaprenol L-rhamnosyltransferase
VACMNAESATGEEGTLRLGVVLVAYRSNDVLPGCLDSLATAVRVAGLNQPESVTVVVVNNDRNHEVAVLDERPWQQIVIDSDTNVGFSPAVNTALASLPGTDYVLLLNPDARLAPDALKTMIGLARERHAALVGPLLVGEDGCPHGASERAFHSIRREVGRQLLATSLYSRHYGRGASRTGDARCLTGACLLVERRFFSEVGGLDTAIHMYLEDVMLCWQAHMAHRPVVLALDARCEHTIGGSTGGINNRSSIALYLMILGARAEFVRRQTGALGAYGMRLLFVLGAILRCARRDASYRSMQQAVIWWAVVSGEAPEWRDGPYVELPAFLTRER